MTPAGWPHGLVSPDHEDFVGLAVKWLLDQGPADLRTSPLRQYPLALALYLDSFTRGAIVGARHGYSQTRSNLDGIYQASDLETVQQALASEGARLVALQRELSLVIDGLQRKNQRP